MCKSMFTFSTFMLYMNPSSYVHEMCDVRRFRITQNCKMTMQTQRHSKLDDLLTYCLLTED